MGILQIVNLLILFPLKKKHNMWSSYGNICAIVLLKAVEKGLAIRCLNMMSCSKCYKNTYEPMATYVTYNVWHCLNALW